MNRERRSRKPRFRLTGTLPFLHVADKQQLRRQGFPLLLTLRQAATALAVHPNTVRRWDRDGRLKSIRIGARRDRRFSRQQVLARSPESEHSPRQRQEKRIPFMTEAGRVLARILALSLALTAVVSYAPVDASAGKSTPVTFVPLTCTGWSHPENARFIDNAQRAESSQFTSGNSAYFTSAGSPGNDADQLSVVGSKTFECHGWKQSSDIDLDQRLSNVQLRLSFAGFGPPDGEDVVTLQTSTDGKNWKALRSFVLRGDFSNATNEGYILFPLNDISALDELQSIRIRVVTDTVPSAPPSKAWIDGVALEAKAQTRGSSEIERLEPTSCVGWSNAQAATKINNRTNADRKDFGRNESAILERATSNFPGLETFDSRINGLDCGKFPIIKNTLDSEILNSSLVLSLAGVSRSESEDVLVPQYSVDGGSTWRTVEPILVRGEFSNQTNGGYWYSPLPTDLTREELANLVVRLDYRSGELPAPSTVLIDGVALELGVRKVPGLKKIQPSALSFLSKRFFLPIEEPIIFIEEDNLQQIDILDASGKPAELPYLVSTEKIGDDERLKVQVQRRRQIRPGTYTIKLKFRSGWKTIEETQTFTWGLVSMNSPKSSYAVGENVPVAIGAVDQNGRTVCNADLALTVTKPDGSSFTARTADGTITGSAECGPKSITALPDYLYRFTADEAGTYNLKLEVQTDRGAESVESSVDVTTEPRFTIERVGPTRINPKQPYLMHLFVTPSQDFTGKFTDVSPASFALSEVSANGSVSDGDTGQDIAWEVDWKKGKEYELTYVFDAPDISPALFETGPASFADQREPQPWQIASDEVVQKDKESLTYDPLPPSDDDWLEAQPSLVAATKPIYRSDEPVIVKVWERGFSKSAEPSVARQVASVELIPPSDGQPTFELVEEEFTRESKQRRIRYFVPSADFRPGRYTIRTTVSDGTSSTIEEATVEWGTLGVSLSSPAPQTNDELVLSLATRDDAGSPTCDQPLTLTVAGPAGYPQTYSTKDGTIIRSGECSEGRKAQESSVRFAPLEAGLYTATVRHQRADGEQYIVQKFDVRDRPEPSEDVKKEIAQAVDLPKRDFAVDESPTINVEVKKDPFIGPTVERTVDDVVLFDPWGQPLLLEPTRTDQSEGRTTTAAFTFDPAKLAHHGRYTVKAVVEQDGAGTVVEQDFTWGVLAVNIRRSIELPNTETEIGMAVLDDQGRTLCNATVELRVTDPQGQTQKFSTPAGTITKDPECVDKGVTNNPDYAAKYTTAEPGTYRISVTAETENGVRTLDDSFVVATGAPFDVERTAFPTRIYPKVDYTHSFTIAPAADYQGTVAETYPASFVVKNISNGGIETPVNGGLTQLVWNVDWKAGETYQLSYTVDFPDVSPEFYLLGPLRIGSFSEARQWQIASDAVGGQMELYLHRENTDANTYNALTLSRPAPTTATESTTVTALVTPAAPCESAVMPGITVTSIVVDDDSTPPGTGDNCLATFYSSPVGQSITIDTTDTNALYWEIYGSNTAADSANTNFVLRLYKLSGVTFTQFGTLTTGDLATGAVTNVKLTATATPSTTVTLAAGDRVVGALSINVIGLDGSTGNDLTKVLFGTSVSPSFARLSYTAITPTKPDLTGAKDDDFTTALAKTNCSNAGITYNTKWTCTTPTGTTLGNIAADVSAGLGSSQWLVLEDQEDGTLGTNFDASPENTYIYQTVDTNADGDGDITTVVNSTINSAVGTSPFFHTGIVLWTSNTDYVILEATFNGTNRGVATNSNGTIADSTAITDYNRIWLRWSKSGSVYTAKYSTDGTTFTSLATTYTHATTFTRVGLTAYAAAISTNYSAAFEWFDYALAAAGITVSGNANVASATIRVAVNSTLRAQTATSAAGPCPCAWTISSVTTPASADVVTVWIDAVADSSEATDVTKYDNVGNITGMVLGTATYPNLLTIGSADNQSLTVANLDLYDCTQDEDIMHDAAGTTLLVEGGTGCAGAVANSYADENIDTLVSNTLTIGATETLTTDNVTVSGTLTSGGASTYNVSGNFTNSGTFTASTSTANFTSTATGNTINPGTSSMNNVAFNGSGGGWSVATNALTVAGDLTMTAGTLSGSAQNITVNGTVACGASCGTINLTGAAFEQRTAAAANFGTNVAVATEWTFFNLTFSASTASTITFSSTGTGNINVTGVLTVGGAAAPTSTVNFGNRTVVLSGTGTPFVITANGIFTASTSTINYTADGAVTVAATTYNNLTFSPTITLARTYTMGGAVTVNSSFNSNPSAGTALTLTTNLGGAFTVTSGITLQGAGVGPANSTLDPRPVATDYDIAAGSITINAASNLDATGSAMTITLTGTSGTLFTRGGTFTQGTSDVQVTSASGTPTLLSAATTFHKLTLNTASTVVNSGAGITINNVLGAALNIQQGKLNDGGNQITGPGGTNGTLTIAASAELCLGGNTSCATSSTTATTLPVFQTYTLNTTSTVTYLANAAQSIAQTPTYGNLKLAPVIATSGKTYTFDAGAITINGNLDINPDAASALALTVNLGGNITVALGKTTTITRTTSATSLLDLRPISTDYNLTTGLLNIATGGTLDATSAASTITLTSTGASVFVNSGTFTYGTSTVNYTGTAATTVLGMTGTAGTNGYNNLGVGTTSDAGAAVTYTLGGNTTVSGTLTVGNVGSTNTDVLDGSSFILTLSGSGTPFSITSKGSYTASTSTVNYTGSSATTAAVATYNNLGVGTTSDAGAAVTYTLGGNIEVSGTLTVGNAGSTNTDTLAGSSYTLTLSGTVATPFSITAKGTFSAGTSTVSYTGVNGAANVNVTTATYSGLGCSPASAETYDVAGSFTVSGTLTVGTNCTLSIATAQTLTHSGATLTLNGTISGAGRYTYQSATAFPTAGTIDSILRMDATNNDQTLSGRTYGGLVEIYSNSTTNRTATFATGSYTFSGAFNPRADNNGDVLVDAGTNSPTVSITGDLDFTGTGNGTEVLAAGDGTWTVSGNVTLTDGVFGPQISSLIPAWSASALQEDTVGAPPDCIFSTVYSCVGGDTNTIGNVPSSVECEFSLYDLNKRYRTGIEYNPTTIAVTATILQVQLNPYVATAVSNAIVGRSTQDNLSAADCSSATGTYSKISGSEYLSASNILNTTGTKIVDLGTTAVSDVQSRLTGTARLSVGINADISDIGTINSYTNSVNKPILRVAYVDTVTTSTMVMNGTSKTLTSAGNHLYNLTLSGTITLANATHTVDGNLDLTGGDVTPGTSTMVMAGAGKTLTAPAAGDTLYALTIDPQTAGTVTVATGGGTVDLTVSNSLTVATGDTLSIGASRTVSHTFGTNTANSGTISGAGTLRYTNTSGGPGTSGTLSSVVRYDATAVSIASTTFDARTYGGKVEIFSSSAAARSVTFATGTYTVSGATSHLYVISDGDSPGNLTLAGATNNPTVTIGGDLDFTGAGTSSEIITSGTGNWSVAGNVNFTDGTYTATAGNTLTMNGTTKTLTTASQTLQNLTLSGSITLANATHTVAGNFSMAGGTITAGTSTVTMTGTSNNITGGGNTLNNLTIDPTSAGTITLNTSDLTVSATLLVETGDDTLSLSSGRTLTLSGASGTTLTNSGTISGDGRLTYQTATAFPTAGTISSILRFDATSATSQIISSRTYGGAVEIYNSGGTSKTVASGSGTMAFSSTLELLRADTATVTLDLNTTDPTTTTVTGALTIGAGTTLSAPSTNAFNINGNYTNNGTFTHNSGTVTLGGTAQQALSETLSGATGKFNNLTVTNSFGDGSTTWSVTFAGNAETAGTFTAATANTKLRFNAGSTYTFVNINFNGLATTTRVFLRSSTSGIQWNINVAGTRTVSNTSVKDSNACGQSPNIDAYDTSNADAGGNSCWDFDVKLTFAINDIAIGFGTLSSSAARYATGDTTGNASEVEAHTIAASTNARSGYSITITNSGAATTLTSGTPTVTAIGAANTASSAGTEQFGVRFTATGGSGTVSVPYAAAGFALDTAAFPDEIASATGTSASTTFSARYLANITATTEAGDYSVSLRYVVTATF